MYSGHSSVSTPRFYDGPEYAPIRLQLLRAEREKGWSMQIWAELTAEIELEMGGHRRLAAEDAA